MENNFAIDMVWWVSAVEIPALSGLWWLVWRTRQQQDAEIAHQREMLEATTNRARDALAAYKLEVAKTYASISYLKDVERRLTDHLLRIEAKLDHAPYRSSD